MFDQRFSWYDHISIIWIESLQDCFLILWSKFGYDFLLSYCIRLLEGLNYKTKTNETHTIVNQKFTNHVSNFKWIRTNESYIIVNLKFTYCIISAMEAHNIVYQKFTNRWQDRLGYPGSIMMHKLFGKKMNIYWRGRRFFNLVTIVCYYFPNKVDNLKEWVSHLYKVLFNLIHWSCESLGYYMIWINVSTKWSHVYSQPEVCDIIMSTNLTKSLSSKLFIKHFISIIRQLKLILNN